MATSLGDLRVLQNYTLGTAETNLYTESMRVSAINRAMKTIVMMYDLDEYIQSTTITCTSGVGNVPLDCMRPNLLISTSLYNQEYALVDFETFNSHNYNIYTIKYDAATSRKRIHTWPANTASFTFTYVQAPEVLVDSADTIRLGDYWDQGIAEMSAAILLRQTRSYDVAQDKDASAKKMLDDAYQNDRPTLQGRALTRLQSIYDRVPMFGNTYFTNFSMSGAPCTTMTWQTITANSTALPNYGYFTEGTGTRSVTLPESADINEGDVIGIAYSSAPWIIQQNAGQSIVFGDQTTTVGIGGYIGSTLAGDALTLVYRGDESFQVLPGAIGNITIV